MSPIFKAKVVYTVLVRNSSIQRPIYGHDDILMSFYREHLQVSKVLNHQPNGESDDELKTG